MADEFRNKIKYGFEKIRFNHSHKPERRFAAMHELLTLTSDPNLTRRVLIKGVRDTDRSVAIAAIEQLKERTDPQDLLAGEKFSLQESGLARSLYYQYKGFFETSLFGALLDRSADDDAEIQTHAVETVHHILSNNRSPQLATEVLGSRNEDITKTAIDILQTQQEFFTSSDGYLRGKFLYALIWQCQSQKEQIRMHARKVLQASYEIPENRWFLLIRLYDRDRNRRDTITLIDELKQLQDVFSSESIYGRGTFSVFEGLLNCSSNDDLEIRTHAVDALREVMLTKEGEEHGASLLVYNRFLDLAADTSVGLHPTISEIGRENLSRVNPEWETSPYVQKRIQEKEQVYQDERSLMNDWYRLLHAVIILTNISPSASLRPDIRSILAIQDYNWNMVDALGPAAADALTLALATRKPVLELSHVSTRLENIMNTDPHQVNPHTLDQIMNFPDTISYTISVSGGTYIGDDGYGGTEEITTYYNVSRSVDLTSLKNSAYQEKQRRLQADS